MKDYIKGSIAGTVLMALWCLYWLYTPSIKENKPEWPSQKEAYRAWRATQFPMTAAPAPVVTEPRFPIHLYANTNLGDLTILNQDYRLKLPEQPKELLRINAERTVYTFSTTNCELVYVDTNGVKFKGQWVREFTNDWKWSDPTNNYMDGFRDGRQQRQKEIEFMLRDYIK